ncbi:MAG TPA: hypothetical protein VFO65_07925, partial [Acidimicrobiales bacterium]|nr:hypothetical protein [Acidimicrobiales bacterium]
LRIAVEGDLGAGDEVTVVDRPDHGLTVAMVARAYDGDHDLLPRMLAVHGLTEGWTLWAVEHAARRLRRAPEDGVLRRALDDRLLAAGIPAEELDAAIDQLADDG